MNIESFKQYSCPHWSDFPDIELYMDQVISVLERYLAPFSFSEEKSITSTMINNYVKQRIISPPQNKRYQRSQLALLFMVCVLKKFMQLSEISLLLENLKRERSDEEVYALFTKELEDAIHLVFKSEAAVPEAEGTTEKVVRASCMAFAAILYSRMIFFSAAEIWPHPEAEEEKKEKEKKDKKKSET